MHGVDWGKSWRLHQRFTYQYSFFVDPTISALTSGSPSQNVDLGGLSFPRCIGIRLHSDFLEAYHLVGMQARWMSYEDKDFTKPLGKDFAHEDMITREGWAKYYFKGKYPRDIAYIKLEIVNPGTDMTIRSFYFQFRKSYQTSLDGRYYMTDPVLGDKIVKNGILTEMKRYKTKDGTIVYRKGKTMFKQNKIKDVLSVSHGKPEPTDTIAIIRNMVRYSEKPKMVFLVTPPHLMKYAKLILILLKQLVDLNFDKSYMTKSNQKPLYKTRFMLDELGNLQSEGHGINGFATMLSIGLGQEQQFTLILQTLQQLRDVYGDSVDKIVQGNVSNIVFLKSTDDSMLDTLQKMSGTTHKTYIDSKNVTVDKSALFMQVDNKVSYTPTTKEVPVITYNDMAFISERNSIVFRAGDPVVWNRNETILPMSWRLFSNTIKHAGHDYTLQTIPTLSTVLDFDLRKNQPDFEKMLNKRMRQANLSVTAQDAYKKAYDYKDIDIARLDPDNYADDIMEIINGMIEREDAGGDGEPQFDENFTGVSSGKDMIQYAMENAEENTEVLEATKASQEQYEQADAKIYANGMISRNMLVSLTGGVNHVLDNDILQVYNDIRNDFAADKKYFYVKDGSLYDIQSQELYIEKYDPQKCQEELKAYMDRGGEKDSNVYVEENIDPKDLTPCNGYKVTDAFYQFLACQDRWSFAGGKFDAGMARRLSEK